MILHVLPWSLWLALVVAVLVAVALATRRPLGVIAILLVLALAASRPAPEPAPSTMGVDGIEQAGAEPSVAQGRTAVLDRTLPAAIGTGPARLAEAGDPNPSPVLRGIASWYRTPGLTAAAGPALRRALGDWRGARVVVCAGECVAVTLTDWCQCHVGSKSERVIDLSDEAFSRLAPLAAGLVRVRVVNVVPPATDAVPRGTP